MKTYSFPIVLEQAGDAWHVCVPELEAKGAATWGKTRDEALRNIQEVVQMVVEELLEDGEPLPQSVTVFEQPQAAEDDVEPGDAFESEFAEASTTVEQ